MKSLFLATRIALLLICSTGLQAQSGKTALNQVELVKQFTGSWRGAVSKDTTINWEIRNTGTSVECNFKYIVNGSTFIEGKQIWDFDSKIDKYVLSSTAENMGNYVLWFITKNRYMIIPYNEISNPEKASDKMEGEFKSPDLFVQTSSGSINPVSTITYKRIKQ